MRVSTILYFGLSFTVNAQNRVGVPSKGSGACMPPCLDVAVLLGGLVLEGMSLNYFSFGIIMVSVSGTRKSDEDCYYVTDLQ